MDIALLLVGENDFSGYLLGDPALELDWEVELLAGFDLHRVGLDGKVWASVELDPVADRVLGWVAEFDVLGNHVAEYCWELDLRLGDVVRKALVQLDAEE